MDHADGFPASGAGQSADRLGPDGDPRHRLQPAELPLHLLPRLWSEHRRPPDALPLGLGPLLALDAAVPDVAPLPLGDGQSEVQQELAGGGGGLELPLGEDHQVDAGVGHVPDETEAVHGPAADAVDGGDHQGVAGLQPGPEVPQGLAVAPGARADLGDDLVDAVVLELLGLGLQVALVLGGLADPGEADDEGKAVDGGPLRLVFGKLGEAYVPETFVSRVSAGRRRSWLRWARREGWFIGGWERGAENARFPQNADRDGGG